MNKLNELLGIAAIVLLFASCSDSDRQERIKTQGPELIDFRVLPFEL